MKKLLIVAGALGAGIAARRLLAEPEAALAEPAPQPVSEPPAAAPGGAPEAAAPVDVPAPPARRFSRNGTPTRDELYEKAKALGIKGRSGMSKQELLEAVRAAGG
jgi:hypothetical protein